VQDRIDHAGRAHRCHPPDPDVDSRWTYWR
jgi:hypothetical protein